MKIYLFNSEHPMVRGVMDRGAGYCGVTSCLLEGFAQLGLEVTAMNQGLHVTRTGPFGDGYDLYVVQRSKLFNQARVFRLLKDHGCLERTAFVDGHDYVFGPDFFWLGSPAIYFQKENFGEYGTRTLLFGIEDRFIPGPDPPPAGPPGRRVMLAYRYETHPDRAVIRQRLREAGFDVVCNLIEDPPERRDTLYWQTGRRHNRSYYTALAECSVGVAAEGEAVDTLRYWEFAASNAVLVSPAVEKTIAGFPNPPVPGVHYVAYTGPGDVVDAVGEALERYDEILPVQREFFLSHHRSVDRARQMLRIMQDSPKADGDRHGHRPIRVADAGSLRG